MSKLNSCDSSPNLLLHSGIISNGSGTWSQLLSFFVPEMSLFCHLLIIPTIVMLMILDLTFLFPLAAHRARHSFVDATLTSMDKCLPHTSSSVWQEDWDSPLSRLFSALCNTFPSSLTTRRVTPADCQQFQCNSWQLAVMHQTFAITNTTHTFIFSPHNISQFRPSVGTLFLVRSPDFMLGFQDVPSNSFRMQHTVLISTNQKYIISLPFCFPSAASLTMLNCLFVICFQHRKKERGIL